MIIKHVGTKNYRVLGHLKIKIVRFKASNEKLQNTKSQDIDNKRSLNDS